MAKVFGNNKHNITWFYANQCWSSLKNDEPLPPIPYYDLWESEETGGKGRIFTGRELIEPCKVTCNGVVVFGE